MNPYRPKILTPIYRYGIPTYLGAVPGLIQMGISKDKEGWEKGKKNLKRGLLLGGAVSGGFIGYDLRKAYQNSRPPTVYSDVPVGLLKNAVGKSMRTPEGFRKMYDRVPLIAASLPVAKTLLMHALIKTIAKVNKKNISRSDKEYLKREYLKSVLLKAPLLYGTSKIFLRGELDGSKITPTTLKQKNIGSALGALVEGARAFRQSKKRKHDTSTTLLNTAVAAANGAYLGRYAVRPVKAFARGLKTF